MQQNERRDCGRKNCRQKHLTDDDIALVRQSVTMADLASAHGLKIERSGMCKCPFHGNGNERTPSMKIFPGDKGFYCYSCHEGGSIFTFEEKYSNLAFPEAVRTIAGMFSIPISDGEEITGEVKAKIRQKRLEQQQKQAETEFNRKRLSELSNMLQSCEELMSYCTPMSGIWRRLADAKYRYGTEWNERFDMMDKK